MLVIVVNVIGLAVIIAIIWWFWLSQAKARKFDQEEIRIEIKDGVYKPAKIEVDNTHSVKLEFVRRDASACSEYVLFEQLGIHEKLPFSQAKMIELGKLAPGTYQFNCQMNMYKGELIVRDKHDNK